MKLTEIDPFKLPKVKLSEVNLLPEKPGIYFAFVKGQMVYIGMTGKGLKSRWAIHHRTDDLSSFDDAEIAYLILEQNRQVIKDIESDLISLYQPPLNGSPVFGRKSARAKCNWQAPATPHKERPKPRKRNVNPIHLLGFEELYVLLGEDECLAIALEDDLWSEEEIFQMAENCNNELAKLIMRRINAIECGAFDTLAILRNPDATQAQREDAAAKIEQWLSKG